MPTKWLVALTLVPLLAIVAVIAVNGPEGPQSAQGIIHPTLPPLGVAVVVNTMSDLDDPGDGTCSLRAAIEATNINGHAGNCDASGSQAGATDGILFNIGTGTPVIDVGSTPLPLITDKLGINGNTGGAVRVELHGPGPGNGDGLTIFGAAATGTRINHMVLDNFDSGLHILAPNVTVTGSFIGTDSTGTSASPNLRGVLVGGGANARIGGTTGLTPGGACTGDCNLISGNAYQGVDLTSGDAPVVQGNFIGLDASGTSSLGNETGILVETSNALIGGTAAGAGNVISGNGFAGINMVLGSMIVQGNFIGTNSAGGAPLPNVGAGVRLLDVTAQPGVIAGTIGGTSAGASNLISGNGSSGIDIYASVNIQIQGNLIGTAADGSTPLPNTSNGVLLTLSDYVTIGGLGAANTIAFNGASGVKLDGGFGDPVSTNSIHDNGVKGIELVNSTNNIPPPTITGVNPMTGTACANCSIEVFSDADGQGKVFEGTSMADNAGNWSLNVSPAGPDVTATATDSRNNTSEFSAPFNLPATPTPTPSPSPGPSLTPTPTPSPTPANTASPTPTATPTGHPSPTAPPCGSPQHRGDADGNGHVDIHDVLATLSRLAGVPPGAACAALAEVDCDGELAADDALRILDFVAGAPLAQPTNCPGVGTLT